MVLHAKALGPRRAAPCHPTADTLSAELGRQHKDESPSRVVWSEWWVDWSGVDSFEVLGVLSHDHLRLELGLLQLGWREWRIATRPRSRDLPNRKWRQSVLCAVRARGFHGAPRVRARTCAELRARIPSCTCGWCSAPPVRSVGFAADLCG